MKVEIIKFREKLKKKKIVRERLFNRFYEEGWSQYLCDFVGGSEEPKRLQHEKK